MSRQLVLIHGRAQEHRDAAALKAEWLDALDAGLRKSGLTLPIAESDVRFPYCGDTLFDMAGGASAEDAADVIVRGAAGDAEEQRFVRAVILQVAAEAGVTDAEVAEAAGAEVVERGPANWAWVQAILRVIDRRLPGGSGGSIALVTRDVYRYLRSAAIREEIAAGVTQAITPGVETVVVAHSLGSVVAYDLLRREGALRGWKVPLLVTVGSPLAIEAIRRLLRTLATVRTPECASAWLNARDPRDVVALYPLDPAHFPLAGGPAIENRSDVRNHTDNRHGISGYLDDPAVARRIHDALAG